MDEAAWGGKINTIKWSLCSTEVEAVWQVRLIDLEPALLRPASPEGGCVDSPQATSGYPARLPVMLRVLPAWKRRSWNRIHRVCFATPPWFT